jgi:hypothetical protein
MHSHVLVRRGRGADILRGFSTGLSLNRRSRTNRVGIHGTRTDRLAAPARYLRCDRSLQTIDFS